MNRHATLHSKIFNMSETRATPNSPNHLASGGASSSGDIATRMSLLSTHQSPSNGSPESPTERKTVSFSPEARCLVIPSHHDMTEAQRAATWISPEEANANQEDTVKTIRAAHRLLSSANRTQHGDDVVCFRGLENVIFGTKRLKLIQQQRDDLVRNVLLVQERHRQMGHDNADPNMLQAISETLSQDHVTRAIMLGASDAAYVRRQMGRD